MVCTLLHLPYLCEDGLQDKWCNCLPLGLSLGQPIIILYQSTVPFQVVGCAVLEESEKGRVEKEKGKE